MFTGSST